jgi:uncharacterized protein (TIGR00255 family)
VILSMTGYGDARQQSGERLVAAEVRTVNNRYLKVNLRCPDSYASIESDIERLVRNRIARGTVSLTLRAETLGQTGRYRIDRDVVIGYWEQMTSLTDHLGLAPPQEIASLLQLPGVISEEGAEEIDLQSEWPLIESVVESALVQLDTFRRREGESMSRDLSQQCQAIRRQLGVVAERAPSVVVQYRDRLLERVSQLLKDSEAAVSDADLIREVSVFADRCDINEEIMRLGSHLDQFDECLAGEESAGRKLEFLCQEMFREVNTIGSKSNNVDIAHAVVEMKGTVERLREVVQNVE